MTGAEFVRGVMRRLDVQTAAELAEVMHWKRGAERTVARWLADDTKPSFDYVMEMVERAGLLNGTQTIRFEPGEDPPAPAERRQLAENDEAILENQNAAMRLLEEIRAALVPQPSAASSAPTRSRRRS